MYTIAAKASEVLLAFCDSYVPHLDLLHVEGTGFQNFLALTACRITHLKLI